MAIISPAFQLTSARAPRPLTNSRPQISTWFFFVARRIRLFFVAFFLLFNWSFDHLNQIVRFFFFRSLHHFFCSLCSCSRTTHSNAVLNRAFDCDNLGPHWLTRRDVTQRGAASARRAYFLVCVCEKDNWHERARVRPTTKLSFRNTPANARTPVIVVWTR